MPSTPRKRHIEIQDRDLEVLRGLFESRIMTAQHVADLYFDGRYEAARKRLQGLKAAGYVGERPRKVYEPAILFLTRKAFALLCEQGAIADYPRMTWASLEKRVRVSDLTLRHELAVMDVKAALVKAVRQTKGLEVMEFSTWPLLYQFESRRPSGEQVTVKPDGFIRIQEKCGIGETFEHVFFLEVDRSTEPLDTLVQRALAYRDFYRRGGFAIRCGRPSFEFERFPFRVLVILKNLQRRNNLAETLVTCRPPISSFAWVTTFAKIILDPLGPVWVRPGDYRAALQDTQYDVHRRVDRFLSRADREAFVEERVSTSRLLAC